ncbi:MAG: hypothetical protein IPN71_00915 [Fibrobacteres bacterium]|nr:hypothetical protein [Fibrobacterota bacterium]
MPFHRAPGAKRLLVRGLGSLVLSLVLVGAVSQPQAGSRKSARVFRGAACLPLSGDLAPLGVAFRQGFLAALDSTADSTVRWDWRWHDGLGDPLETSRWLERQTRDSADLALVGISSATVNLGRCPLECMVVGDGGVHAKDSLRWDLWTPAQRQAQRLLARLREGKPPRGVVFESTGAWAEVIHHVSDSMPDLLLMPHDLDNTRWDEPVRQILVTKPRTVLFWNGPVDAQSFLGRRLAWTVLSQAQIWVPEGTQIPAGLAAQPMAPLWQAQTPADSVQIKRWHQWGREVGLHLAQASHLRIQDSLPQFRQAFRKVPTDATVEVDSSAWFPKGP